MRRALVYWLVFGLGTSIGVAISALDPTPETQTLACDQVITGSMKIEPLVPNAPRPYEIEVPLAGDRPAALIVIQLIDARGFGWTTRSPPEGTDLLRTQIDNVPDTQLFRLGVLTAEEHGRAQRIEAAASRLDVVTWWENRGYVAPRLEICQAVELS